MKNRHEHQQNPPLIRVPCPQCWSHWCSSTSRTLGLGQTWVEVGCRKVYGSKEQLQKLRSILLVPLPFYRRLTAAGRKLFSIPKSIKSSQYSCEQTSVTSNAWPLGVYWAGHGSGCCMNDLVLLGRVCKYFFISMWLIFCKTFWHIEPTGWVYHVTQVPQSTERPRRIFRSV